MPGLQIDTDAWVIVCDGRKALILKNVGDRKFPNLRQLDTRERRAGFTHELGTDAPGRVNPSVGRARSSVDQTDWHDDAERAFLQSLAEYLDAAVRAGEAKSLIIVAPPRALGMLRKAYTSAITQALRNEIDKDLVKHPIDDIEKQLFS